MEDIYLQMTDKIMLTGSKIIPQLFRMIVDTDEAVLLFAMPGTPKQLDAAIDRNPKDVAEICRILYRKESR